MNPDAGGPINGTGNVGGWENSEIRTYLNDETAGVDSIYNALPEDLRNVIVKTKVISGHDSKDSSNFTTLDKLYLLSTNEVWGKEGTSLTVTGDTAEGETRQLDYYRIQEVTTSNYSGATKNNLEGVGTNWWLRSAYSYSGSPYYYVYYDGIWGQTASNNDYGVAPAFKVA